MKGLLVCFILLFWAPMAEAVDFYQAKKWHRLGDYQKSFDQLLKQARLGYAPAQVAIAESYAMGYGTKVDFQSAYAWALMAKDQGHPMAEPLYLDYRTRLTSRRAGKQLYQQIKAQYGLKALRQALYPKVHSIAMHAGRQPEPVKTPEPQYPTEVYEQQNAFWLLLQFDVNESGKTENIEVLASFPDQQQVNLVKQTVENWRFKPVTDEHDNPLRFDFQTRLFSLYKENDSFIGSPQQQQVLTKAKNGHAEQQYLLSKLIEFELISSNHGSALDWLIRAAINGFGKAQFELYQCLNYQGRCEANQNKAMQWLKMAEQAGESRTKMQLVKAYMAAQGQDPKKAKQMLQALVQSNHLPALILYAKLLATSEDETVKDSHQAIKFARQAMALDNNHPQLLAVLAIAHYDLKQPDEGQSLLMEAIKEAEYRRWPIDYYVNLLADYQRATLLQPEASKTIKQ